MSDDTDITVRANDDLVEAEPAIDEVWVAPASATIDDEVSRDQARTPIAVGPAVSALLDLAQTVQTQSLLTVVGPQHLLDGIKSGTLRVLSTSTGKTGTVVDVLTGKVVGQLRFRGAPIAVPTVATLFQIASAVTLQYYLHEITARLNALSTQLGHVMELVEGTARAELDVAFTESAELAETLDRFGHLSERDFPKLVAAERAANLGYQRDLVILTRFSSHAEQIGRIYTPAASTIGTARFPRGMNELKALLKRLDAEVSPTSQALSRLLIASVTRARLLLIRAAAESAIDSDLAEVAAQRVRTEMGSMQSELGALRLALETPTRIDDAVLSRLLVADRRPLSAVAAYRRDMEPLLDILGGWSKSLVNPATGDVGVLTVLSDAAGPRVLTQPATT
jgi:hypothetical protein